MSVIFLILFGRHLWERRRERESGAVRDGYRYRLNMSETISTSVSAAAIFSAEESWGRAPKRKDILGGGFLDRYKEKLRLDKGAAYAKLHLLCT